MRTKEEIMKDAAEPHNFETLAEMHGWLMVEIACDQRDEQIAHNDRMESKAHFAVRDR